MGVLLQRDEYEMVYVWNQEALDYYLSQGYEVIEVELFS